MFHFLKDFEGILSLCSYAEKLKVRFVWSDMGGCLIKISTEYWG